jgi:hypothetical protein
MGRMKAIGVCVLAALAVASVTTATASGEAPEFGRCLKQAGGKFKNGACTVAAVPGEERYEWLPGVVATKFTMAAKEGALIGFETVAGTKLFCQGQTGSGEITGPKSLTATLTFTACEGSKEGCTSAGQPHNTIVTKPLQGELGTIQKGEVPTKSKAGLELAPAEGSVLVECNVSTIHVVMSGSVIATVPVNSMKTVDTIKFTAGKGKQKPERFEGGPLSVLEWNAGSGAEQLGLTLTTLLTTEEKVEVSTVN